MMDERELEHQAKEHQDNVKFLKAQGAYDENEQITEKGFEKLRKRYLDEDFVKDYFHFYPKHMRKIKNDEEGHYNKAISTIEGTKDESLVSLLMPAVLEASASMMFADIIEDLFIDIAAIARNQLDLRSDLRDVVDTFGKSDSDAKVAIHNLRKKMKKQDKNIAESIKYFKWFRRYEKDRIKGVA